MPTLPPTFFGIDSDRSTEVPMGCCQNKFEKHPGPFFFPFFFPDFYLIIFVDFSKLVKLDAGGENGNHDW